MNNDLPAVRPVLRRANAFNYGNVIHPIVLYVMGGISFPLDAQLIDAPHWYQHFMTQRDNGQLNDNSYIRLLNVVNRYNEINANPIMIHHHFRGKQRSRKSQRKNRKSSPRRKSMRNVRNGNKRKSLSPRRKSMRKRK